MEQKQQYQTKQQLQIVTKPIDPADDYKIIWYEDQTLARCAVIAKYAVVDHSNYEIQLYRDQFGTTGFQILYQGQGKGIAYSGYPSEAAARKAAEQRIERLISDTI